MCAGRVPAQEGGDTIESGGMGDHSAARRIVYLLEELESDPVWLAELERQFEVIRSASVIGMNRAVQNHVLAAAVLSLVAPEKRVASVAKMLRAQPNVAEVPLIVLAPAPVDAVQRALTGFDRVEVMDVERARLSLRSRILGYASVARTAAGAGRLPAKKVAPPEPATPHAKHQKRFFENSIERGRRAIALSDELRRSEISATRRTVLLGELKDLLNLMKGEATLLGMRPLAEVLSRAEVILEGLDAQRKGLMVPRGVVGLLHDLAEGHTAPHLFDVELHRMRLGTSQQKAVSIYPPGRSGS
jgi:hypothetical protein